MKSTRVAVIGMGYVGIPAAALFADEPGFQVLGVQRRSAFGDAPVVHLLAVSFALGGETEED